MRSSPSWLPSLHMLVATLAQAVGPRSPSGIQIAEVSVVAVYPRVLAILGLPNPRPGQPRRDTLTSLLSDPSRP